MQWFNQNDSLKISLRWNRRWLVAVKGHRNLPPTRLYWIHWKCWSIASLKFGHLGEYLPVSYVLDNVTSVMWWRTDASEMMLSRAQFLERETKLFHLRAAFCVRVHIEKKKEKVQYDLILAVDVRCSDRHLPATETIRRNTSSRIQCSRLKWPLIANAVASTSAMASYHHCYVYACRKINFSTS